MLVIPSIILVRPAALEWRAIAQVGSVDNKKEYSGEIAAAMMLLEHDAKMLLGQFGVPVPEGVLVADAAAIERWVLGD